jgi:hypothetical protein
MRMAPPRPTEINTSHNEDAAEKTLKEYTHSSKASGARPTGLLARPHGIAQQPGEKKVPLASISICGILTDTTTDARGLLTGTAIGVPKKPGEPIFFRNKQNTNELTNLKHAQDNHDSVAGAHGSGGLSSPPEQSALATLGRNSTSLEGHNTVLSRLRLARGTRRPLG